MAVRDYTFNLYVFTLRKELEYFLIKLVRELPV